MRQILYVSRARSSMSERDVKDILSIARAVNAEHDITGLLLQGRDCFLQVLEGPHDDVEEVYRRIARDRRHEEVRLLQDNRVRERDFAPWRMGFCRVADPEGESLMQQALESEREPDAALVAALRNWAEDSCSDIQSP